MTHLNLYNHERKTDRHYVIGEQFSTAFVMSLGLVVGDEKVLLIDAGMGMSADLRAYIEAIVGTDKPLICAVSHGSVDHAGSAMLFDERYCNIRDKWMLDTQAFDSQKRLLDVEGWSFGNREVMDFTRANLLDSEGTTFEWIDDGDVIDLGGVTLEVIAMPGHSAGSVAYFDRANRICYTGSAVDMNVQVNNLDFYFNTPEHRALMPGFLGLGDLDRDLSYAECFRLYADIVRRFVGIVGEDVTLYAGHTLLPQTINSAHRVIEACEQIAAGERAGDLPAESPFEYQRNTPEKYKRVHYAGNVGVIYDAAKFDSVAA